jgi:predicted metal-dependent phosphoesterase TrpH
MAVNLAYASAQIAAQDATALKRVLDTITAQSCPGSYNFHMHTVCSDGRLQPEKLMEQAIALNLQGLAITDHHTVNGYRAAQQWLQRHSAASPHLWTGVEINAELLGIEVHVLGYAFAPDHAALQPYLQGKTAVGEGYQAARVIGAIQAAGGLAVLAHPARYRLSYSQLVPEAARLGIDGIETYYAYSNPQPWQPSPKQTQELEQLSKTYSLLSTCGTDTHGLSLLQRL